MIKKILTFLASIYCSALLLNYTEKYIKNWKNYFENNSTK